MSEPELQGEDLDAVDAVAEMLEGISQVLVGRAGHLQGAAIGEALAMWLAGHPDFVREAVITQHLAYVRALIPEAERELFSGGAHPQNIGRQAAH